MHDERFLPAGGTDPLRFIDPRFEPHDPIFDAEEPAFAQPWRKRRTRAGAAAALIAASLACGGPNRPAIHATDSILVQLEPGAAPPSRAPAEDSSPPIVALAAVSEEEGPLLRVPLLPGEDPEAAAEDANRQPGVTFAEPVYVYQTAKTPDDSRYKDLWGLQKIDAPAAWSKTVGDPGVTVAVVDDGVSLTHPDLKANLWVNPDEIAGNHEDDDQDGIVDDVYGADFVDGDGDPSPAPGGDAPYHGSHVSGTIGATGDNRAGVVGVNWKVSLMAVRGIGPQGGRSDALAKSIDYAVDHGARVINASWGGGGTSQVIVKAIERAGKRGVLFVAAAGNESASKPGFPANIGADNLISVGATTPNDTLANFSNRGAMVAAPGVGILSTTSPGQYERYDGTSMASPHVAGLAALLWAAYPDATLAQVRKAILDSGLAVKGVQHGRVDAAKAMDLLGRETGGAGKNLVLSRNALSFAAAAGRIPRAQTVSLRADSGGAQAWTANASANWIVLPKTSGKTPARVTVRMDPSKLKAGKHEGTVSFQDGTGGKISLAVSLQIGNAPAVAVEGAGCEMRDDGSLHVRAGSGCALRAADGDASGVQWRLPGGTQLNGSRLYGQFVRRGAWQVLLSRDEGEVDALAVVIE